MGIIILPFLLGAFIVGIISMIKVIRLLRSQQAGFKEMLFGLAISIAIFGLICLSYLMKGKAWGLSPAFRIPIIMVFIPFVFHMSTEKSKNPNWAYLSKIILISVMITTILGVIFNDIFFNLIDYLGIETYY